MCCKKRHEVHTHHYLKKIINPQGLLGISISNYLKGTLYSVDSPITFKTESQEKSVFPHHPKSHILHLTLLSRSQP